MIWTGHKSLIGIHHGLIPKTSSDRIKTYHFKASKKIHKHLLGSFQFNFWAILPGSEFWEPFLELYFPKSYALQKDWVDVTVKVKSLDNSTLSNLDVNLHHIINYKYKERFQNFNLTMLKSCMLLLQLDKLVTGTTTAKVYTSFRTQYRDKRPDFKLSGILTFKTNFSFFLSHRYQPIALSGLIKYVHLRIKKAKGSYLNIYWIDNNFVSYKYFLEKDPYLCQKRLSISPYCFNFSNVIS